jgi:hypothetical protein
MWYRKNDSSPQPVDFHQAAGWWGWTVPFGPPWEDALFSMAWDQPDFARKLDGWDEFSGPSWQVHLLNPSPTHPRTVDRHEWEHTPRSGDQYPYCTAGDASTGDWIVALSLPVRNALGIRLNNGTGLLHRSVVRRQWASQHITSMVQQICRKNRATVRSCTWHTGSPASVRARPGRGSPSPVGSSPPCARPTPDVRLPKLAEEGRHDPQSRQWGSLYLYIALRMKFTVGPVGSHLGGRTTSRRKSGTNQARPEWLQWKYK